MSRPCVYVSTATFLPKNPMVLSSCLLRRACDDGSMNHGGTGLVIWDVDGTLIPADLRWLTRAISRAYGMAESEVVFPDKKVHGYTDESIAIDTAITSGVDALAAEAGIPAFREAIAAVMQEGRRELAEVQPPYPGAAASIAELHGRGFHQTVLTGNLRSAAEVKLQVSGLDEFLDLRIGGFGSDARDRFQLPAVVAGRYLATYGQQLDPDRVIVIGDAPNDIACARHAGFHVAVVAHRIGHQELASHHPDVVLDSLDPTAVVAAVNSLWASGGSPATS
ncbi:HAD family hydrolase [Micromonospora sp. NPDC049107]|uniref:HAD family hydrolase n=1 Tax=unclassified Micromonospora TaxID=2617518 RepID=UPI003400B2B9